MVWGPLPRAVMLPRQPAVRTPGGGDRNAAAQRAACKVGVEFTDKTVQTYRVLKLVGIRRSDDLV